MKKNHFLIALVACGAMLVSSCHHHHRPYFGGSVSVGYSNGYADAWVSASYDSNGFPIYGYSYGRPVYGYTADGLAVFSFAALTASCFVPLWKPAPWYCGHWHYPRHIHRVAKPHRCPAGHHPGRRPSGGLHAPIHKNPHSVLNKHHGHKPSANRPNHNFNPGKPGLNRPNNNFKPGKPGLNRPNNNFKPGKPGLNRPNNNFNPGKPGLNRPNNNFKPSKPGLNRPNNNFKPGKPGLNRPNNNFRPVNKPAASKPNLTKPVGGFKPAKVSHTRPSLGSMKRPSAPARLSPARSNFSRPAASMRSSASRPSFGGGRGSRGGGHRGGRR